MRTSVVPIIEKIIFVLQCGSSSRNCSIAISFKGMPFKRSRRSIPRWREDGRREEIGSITVSFGGGRGGREIESERAKMERE